MQHSTAHPTSQLVTLAMSFIQFPSVSPPILHVIGVNISPLKCAMSKHAHTLPVEPARIPTRSRKGTHDSEPSLQDWFGGGPFNRGTTLLGDAPSSSAMYSTLKGMWACFGLLWHSLLPVQNLDQLRTGMRPKRGPTFDTCSAVAKCPPVPRCPCHCFACDTRRPNHQQVYGSVPDSLHPPFSLETAICPGAWPICCRERSPKRMGNVELEQVQDVSPASLTFFPGIRHARSIPGTRPKVATATGWRIDPKLFNLCTLTWF